MSVKSSKGGGFSININDFSGGLNTLDAPHQLKDNEAVIMTNFEIKGRGAMQKRYGYSLVGSCGTGAIRGLLPFNIVGQSAAKYLCIFQADGHLYSTTPQAGTFTDEGAAFTDDGSRVNGTVFNNLAIFGNGNSAVKQWDGTTLSSLSGAPQGNIFEQYVKSLFISGVTASPQVVYYSDSDDTAFSGGVSGNVAVQVDNGEKVTSLKSHSDQFSVFKDYSKYGLNAVFDSNELTTGFAQKEIVDRQDGTKSGNSVVEVWDGLYFLGEKGFQKYGYQESYPDNRIPNQISYLITPTFNQINNEYIGKATAVFWDNKYYCAAPLGTSATNNTIFVYDKQYGAWYTYSGVNSSDFCIFEDSSGKRKVYFSSELENKIFKFNNKFTDEYADSKSSGISALWRSKTFIPSYKNRFDKVIVKGAMTNPTSFYFKINVDGIEEAFRITNDLIIWENTTSETVGYATVGQTVVGGTIPQDQYSPLSTFIAEIDFPEIINSGTEIFFQVEQNGDNEGVRIDQITCFGQQENGHITTNF